MAAHRICVLGDSHLAALGQGWRQLAPRFPQTQITFFAGLSAEWTSIRVIDGKLVPGTQRLREEFRRSAKGAEEIASGFDAYILCGLKLAVSFPLRLQTHHEHSDWNAYQTAVSGYVRDTIFAQVLARLRDITDVPVVVLAAPHQPVDYCKASPLLDTETAAKLVANFDRECAELASCYNARLITQAAETLAPNGATTDMTFANISKSPDTVDRRHCNAAYGAIAMRHILKTGLGIDPIAD